MEKMSAHFSDNTTAQFIYMFSLAVNNNQAEIILHSAVSVYYAVLSKKGTSGVMFEQIGTISSCKSFTTLLERLAEPQNEKRCYESFRYENISGE